MKRLLFISLAFLPLVSSAQYPEPTNFTFDYDYIMLNEWGVCGGNTVCGPCYCSHFRWSSPDTSETTASFEYYQVYYSDLYSQNSTIIGTSTDTFLNLIFGVLGDVWVTAVYSNPDGESSPSNKITNADLPIAVAESKVNNDFSAFYDDKTESVVLGNYQAPLEIRIYNSNGRMVKKQNINNKYINLQGLSPGLYIIKAMDNNHISFHQKILKR